MQEKVCSLCGKVFIPKFREQMYCSRFCSNKASHEKLKKYHTCLNCGKSYTWNDGHPHKFCSVDCLREWQRNHRIEKPCRETITYQKECAWCGKAFSTIFSSQKYCSHECGYEANKKRHRDKWAEEYIPKTYICKECGTAFTTECTDTHSVFCCENCADRYERRIEHKTERHKKYMSRYKKLRNQQINRNFVEDVSYDDIFKRDHGICQICGLPVLYDKKEDAYWSGTIDHIIPVSLNGEHSMKNCQLAHRVCNSIKNQNTEHFSIDWEQKSKDSRYWAIRFKALKEKTSA